MAFELVLKDDANRKLAKRIIDKAPDGSTVKFAKPKRTLPQNDKLWALLTEISMTRMWRGQKLSPEDWKLLFLDALEREHRVVSSLEGDGVVPLGRSSSKLSKEELSDLIDIIEAWMARE